MYIYNVTIKIAHEIETAWLQWMQEIHMQEVVDTGLFDSYQFFYLHEGDDEEGKTYIAQYYTTHEERYKQYIEEFAPSLREKGYALFGNKFIAFRSILKKIR